jgi:hypothetical protein
MREKSIAVSADEQDRLDEVAEDLLGTDDVPYGAIISAQVEQYESAQRSN